jgi:transcriptional regulator with XRE-family HTH domain
MSTLIDFSSATSEQIEASLCSQLAAIRLARNLTQAQVAREAGVTLRTIGRLEKGQGVSLETFIRVLTALKLQHALGALLPDPTIRPMERIQTGGRERQRSRPKAIAEERGSWSWGDEEEKQP